MFCSLRFASCSAWCDCVPIVIDVVSEVSDVHRVLGVLVGVSPSGRAWFAW